MTRINIVPPSDLSNKHLSGEYHEITRVFNLVRKAQNKGKNKWHYDIPKEYRLGAKHVIFFYDKLKYVLWRYNELTKEMINRGYDPSPVSYKDLIAGIDKHWFGDYTPTDEAIKLNQQRIKERS